MLLKFSNMLLGDSHFKKIITSVMRSKSTSVRFTSEKAKARHFVDFRRVRVTGGHGGNGCKSFLSLYANEWAGPDGGDGGNGGHIIFQADSNVKSLASVKSVYIGQPGEKGHSKHCLGKNAEHTVIKVPVGTFFRDESSQVVADLKCDKEAFVGARGGAGGKGNYFFLSNEDRAPVTYELGGPGEERLLFAEIRVIAHFGLIGFPNAGKSSLLRALTRAKPKVASYPFTTLYPHVGIIEYDDYEQVAVADIPGLITGAHQNYGLGLSFLRHVEQCDSLVYVIDLSLDNPSTQLDQLKFELDQYLLGLADKDHIIVANKIDLPMAAQNLENLKENVKDSTIITVSAKRLTNIQDLFSQLKFMYDSRNKNISE